MTFIPKPRYKPASFTKYATASNKLAPKDQKAFMKDLKPVLQAETLEHTELGLENLDEKWGKKYEKCWSPV